jgi:hypothetical protein
VGHRGPRETSSEVGAYLRGWDPRARRELARGAKARGRGGDALQGRHALEAGGFAMLHPPLERDGGSPEGYRGWRLMAR